MKMKLLIKKLKSLTKINKQNVNLAKAIDKNLNKYLIEKMIYQNIKINIVLKTIQISRMHSTKFLLIMICLINLDAQLQMYLQNIH